MAFRVLINESAASRRCIPLWLVGSNGTTPATAESGATFHFAIGGFHYGSGGSLSVVSAAAGEYVCAFAASKLSVLGPGTVYYQSANAIPSSSPFEVVPLDSYDSMRMGLFALPNAAPATSGGLITLGIGAGQLWVSTGSVGILAQTHSGVTLQGLTNYSNATVGVNNIQAGSYSGVTVEVNNFGRSSMQSMSDRLLSRSLASGSDGGRTVQDALRSLRNKVAIGGSTLTVYQEDDSSSAWTASVTTLASGGPITGFDPGGP